MWPNARRQPRPVAGVGCTPLLDDRPRNDLTCLCSSASRRPSICGPAYESPAEHPDGPTDAVDRHVRTDCQANDQDHAGRRRTSSGQEEHGRWPNVVPHGPEIRHALRVDSKKNLLPDQQRTRDEAAENKTRDDYPPHSEEYHSDAGSIIVNLSV
jgi:hypothetical protein